MHLPPHTHPPAPTCCACARTCMLQARMSTHTHTSPKYAVPVPMPAVRAAGSDDYSDRGGVSRHTAQSSKRSKVAMAGQDGSGGSGRQEGRGGVEGNEVKRGEEEGGKHAARRAALQVLARRHGHEPSGDVDMAEVTGRGRKVDKVGSQKPGGEGGGGGGEGEGGGASKKRRLVRAGAGGGGGGGHGGARRMEDPLVLWPRWRTCWRTSKLHVLRHPSPHIYACG